ncbi:probable basic-leucine zipper transcription factor H [Eupeodes corollae]|uniref:probable basic-leucine zipper transcription factor H n=1 Tax=Eupeodes corollae TaxID=290404 RepID=UPI0024907437|nr:probable basic-leucine zipper transcription factor H [Eupeodes corollae]
MVSLQVAIIILALLTTQLDSYAVSGYSVGMPFEVTSIEDLSSSVESDTSFETTTPCPAAETLNTPVIETTTAPIPESAFEISDQFGSLPEARQFAVVQQNFNITGPSTRNRKKTSCLCKECNPENGFYIKHFRQYNYYYPHGRSLGGHHIPHHLNLFSSDEFLPSDDAPIASSVVTANNLNVVSSSKKSSRPTVRYSPPGVASYVPNNGFNSVYHNHQSSTATRHHQNDDEYARGQSSGSDENLSQNGEQTSSDESPEQTTEPTPSQIDIESATTIPLDDNVSEDIISYLSEPNVFGHAQTTTYNNNNGNNQRFQSQRVSISSHLQSQSQPQNYANSETQQQVGMSSSVRSQGSEQHQQQKQQQQIGSSSSTYQSSSESKQQESVTSNNNHQSQPESSSAAQQQVSVSSSKQSPIVSNSESQQQNQISSSTYQSQTLPAFGSSASSSINWANDYDFGSPNSMTIGYNPYYQSQPFGVLPIVQPPLVPTVPVSRPKKPMNWVRSPSVKPTAPLPVQNKPNTCQYFNNRVRNLPNFSLPPPPLPLFDFTNMSPYYSVIL